MFMPINGYKKAAMFAKPITHNVNGHNNTLLFYTMSKVFQIVIYYWEGYEDSNNTWCEIIHSHMNLKN